MLNDPRLWLYSVIFFASSGLVRFIISVVRKKRCITACVYFALSLVSVSVFWILEGNFTFHTFREGVLFSLCALIPGLLAGLHFSFFLLPIAAVFGLSMYWGLSLSQPISDESRILGSLTCYPSSENRIFAEWAGEDGKPVLGSLTGDNCAVLIRKTVLPDYLFFLETPWEVQGLLSKSINISELQLEGDNYYIPVSPSVVKEELNGIIPVLLKFEYPALHFLDPGYFNSYTYIIRNNSYLSIIERKSDD